MMVAGWEIRYYDEYEEAEFVLPAEFDQISDEVGGEFMPDFLFAKHRHFQKLC